MTSTSKVFIRHVPAELPGARYHPLMVRGNLCITMSGAALLIAMIVPTGVADASPFCYETGPGYEKCISSPSGDYFNPVYQGPKLPDGYVPWVPDEEPSPIYVPPLPSAGVSVPAGPDVTGLVAQVVQQNMQSFFDDPANGKTQYDLHIGRVSLAHTTGASYEGMVAVSTGNGPEQLFPVHVTADDRNVAWNLDPGVLLPLFQ